MIISPGAMGQSAIRPIPPTNGGVGTVYILQFLQPLGGQKHRAEFYIGWCKDGTAEARLGDHRLGRGAAITRAANARNIRFEIVAVLEGDRNTERRLKNQKNTRRILRQIQAGRFTLAKVRWCGWTG
jgi:predicted GIY-YIG superfamily endonuclease